MKKTEKTSLPQTVTARLKKASAASRVAMRLSLPADAVMPLPHIELVGNREITVDGVLSVLNYTETDIALACGKITVTVTGVSLAIERYFADTAIIRGILTGLSFS